MEERREKKHSLVKIAAYKNVRDRKRERERWKKKYKINGGEVEGEKKN